MVNSNKFNDGSSGHRDCSHPSPLSSIDDCPGNVPCAGWRNGTSLNNAGENGNYWSSTPNEENSNNAYNLYFNSGNHNVNWNNRNNGFSVRPVTEFTESRHPQDGNPLFSINPKKLLEDLYHAYKDARKQKRGKRYQLEFEFCLEDNLVALRDELISGAYHPLPSSCFVIHDPKMREVFAAEFRDRIVHHLFYNYTHEIFERGFIFDSYSCINDRGTHFGIKRLEHHIKSVSKNYTGICHVLKIDIKGYFMSIDRLKLWDISIDTLERANNRFYSSGHTEKPDLIFLKYLLERIIFSDPVKECRMIGRPDDWKDLPREKSLFYSPNGCGLPIGNLTSQLFSNIYMNRFDQYMKRILKCRHYGRYVDDAFIVSSDRERLKALIPHIKSFLETELGLRLNDSKTRIFNAYQGVEFLGAFIKPFRTYISSSSLARVKKKIPKLKYCSEPKDLQSSVNSYLGVFSHYSSYCIRKVFFTHISGLCSKGRFDNNILKFKPWGR